MSKELTKQAIINSFVKLLNERPIDKISVKDIVLDCGINRNTFYYHYQDIYDLIEDIFERETQKVINEHILLDSWVEGFIQAAQFALQNKKAIYHIYNSANYKQVERYLNRIAQDLMTTYVKEQARGIDVSDEDISYIALFYRHAVVGITREWIQRGMKDDAEKVILRMGQIFENNIKYSLERIGKHV